MTLRSVGLFVLAALFEIGGAWLVWQAVREHRSWWLAALGVVFVAGSLAWGVLLDGYRPDRFDTVGALICLVGVAIIMYAPR